MLSAKLSVPCGANSLVLLASVTGKRLQKAAAKPSKSTPLLWSKPCNLIHAFVCVHKRQFSASIYVSHMQLPKNLLVSAKVYISFYMEITTDCIVTLLPVSGIYTKAELQLSLKLLCYETADKTQPMGGGPSVSVLLHSIRVITKERNNGDFGFHCWDCLLCLTHPFCSSRRVPRSLVSPVSKVASRKRKVKLTDQYNTLEGDIQKVRRVNDWKKRIDLPQFSAMLP